MNKSCGYWSATGNSTNTDDALMKAYRDCSDGGTTPDVMWADGRTLRAFGIEVPDAKLDAMFEVTNGTVKEME